MTRANPTFSSRLAPAFAQYVDLKRALGLRFDNPIRTLGSLDEFLHDKANQYPDLNAPAFHAWCRTLGHLVNTLTELEAVGCAFVSITNGIDLSTPQGRLMFHIIAAMGEFERELIRERVLSGLADARARGKQLGRPEVNRSRDKDAAAIRKLRDAGESYKDIADELGRSKSDVYRVCMTLNCSPAE